MNPLPNEPFDSSRPKLLARFKHAVLRRIARSSGASAARCVGDPIWIEAEDIESVLYDNMSPSRVDGLLTEILERGQRAEPSDECELGIGDVFALVHGERLYQDARWGEIAHHPHEVGGWLTLMSVRIARAMEAWSRAGEDAALEELRKVIALGVACAEQHGLPEREVAPIWGESVETMLRRMQTAPQESDGLTDNEGGL